MFRIIRKIGKVLNQRQKSRVVILLFMMVISAGLNVLGVGLMIPLMNALMDKDIIQNSKLASDVAAFFHINSHTGLVMFCVLLMTLVYVIKGLYAIFENYMQHRFIANCRFYAQKTTFTSFIRKPYEFFLYASSGELVRLIQQDIDNVFRLLRTILFFFSELSITVALIVALLFISPMITLIVLIVMGGTILLIMFYIKPKMKKQGKSLVKNSAVMNKWLLQAMNGIKEIKVSENENYFRDRFNKSGMKVVESTKFQSVWQRMPQILIEMTSITSALLAVVIQVVGGTEMSELIAQLSAFVMASTRLLPSANRIVNAASEVSYFEPSLNKVIGVLEGTDKKLSLSSDNRYAEMSEHMPTESAEPVSVHESIEIRNISYSYPNSETEVLKDASMVIPVGKSVGIVGTSGAGKTTAVDVMLGLLIPQSGQILADGKDVMNNYKGWLSHIGYIPQSIFMLDDTIRENVVFGENNIVHSDDISGDAQSGNVDLATSDALVWRALEEAQLADFVRSLPEGLDTEIGERGIRLSGGQRQRIGIARALYSSPDILVFDEATSSLDNETESAIMESINSLHGRKTLIIIAHRLTTIEECDIVYRVEDGKIARER